MEREIYKVNPIIIYPQCILKIGKQDDCHTCDKKIDVYHPEVCV